LPDSFIQGSINSIDIILEGDFDILAPILGNNPNIGDFLGEIKLLAKNIALTKLINLNNLLKIGAIILQLQLLINDSLSLNKEQNLIKKHALLNQYLILFVFDQLR
jgi:hypothetical protein